MRVVPTELIRREIVRSELVMEYLPSDAHAYLCPICVS
jgi:hypothetical protein